MIRRTRATAQPKSLEEFAVVGLNRLRKYDSQQSRATSQRRWPFELEAMYQSDMQEALSRAFTHLCAYCETPVAAAPVTGWHRPREEAMQLDGTIARDHYWWLAYEWDNLYLICPDCDSHKGSRFPVGRARVNPEARGKDLDLEQPLLLDPCRDEPEHVLQYTDDGTMVATEERSRTTIDVLGLNRATLVADRLEAMNQIHQLLRDDIPVDNLRQQFEEGMPYAGIRRWTARMTLLQRGNDALIRELGLDDPTALKLARRRVNSATVRRRSRISARLTNVSLESIEIRNFKAISELSLQFRELRPDAGEPWLLLLGENGVGKSSVLKAIALALMNPRTRKRFVPDASRGVRHGTRRGQVRLGFSDGSDVLLSFRRNDPEFSAPDKPPSLPLLGYGPTRLPPPPSARFPQPSRLNVDNLFDPWATLSDAERWLADTDTVPSDRFNLHATDLKTLLLMAEEDRLSRRNGRLYATSFGSTDALPELSDGYRSVIALATDLMLRLSASFETMRTAEGLLLLDEIEVHLHPQWRMTIVSLLREVFPKLRVIATTHDPLCLQQTEPGEVFVIRRLGESGVEAVARDVPKGLRADQLLTGDWFGLSTTTDLDTAEMMTEHARLLIAPRTPAVRKARRELEAQIRERTGHFVETSIERLAQDVTARIVNEESIELGVAEPEERARLAESVLEAVRRRRRQRR